MLCLNVSYCVLLFIVFYRVLLFFMVIDCVVLWLMYVSGDDLLLFKRVLLYVVVLYSYLLRVVVRQRVLLCLL